MIVRQHDHARAAPDRQYLRGGRNAVTDRGNQRDIGGLGIDQPGGGKTRAFMLLVGEGGLERPRRALAENRGAAGLQRSEVGSGL